MFIQENGEIHPQAVSLMAWPVVLAIALQRTHLPAMVTALAGSQTHFKTEASQTKLVLHRQADPVDVPAPLRVGHA